MFCKKIVGEKCQIIWQVTKLLTYEWHRGVVVITTAQLHSTKPFCAGSNPARGVSEIRDDEDLWQWSRLEIRLNTFRRSTIPQKQFIIIITDHFFYGPNFMPTFFLPSYLCLKRMFFRVFFKFETFMSFHCRTFCLFLIVFHFVYTSLKMLTFSLPYFVYIIFLTLTIKLFLSF